MIYKDIMQNEVIFSPVHIEERRMLNIRAGDTVRVWQRIQEGERKRLQAFEGLIIARKHGAEAGATFTVRRTASGVGVERVFPLYSPLIQKIELISRSKVRRAKLYYIRDRAAREVRRKMKAIRQVETTLADEDVAPNTEIHDATAVPETEQNETQNETVKEKTASAGDQTGTDK